MKYFKQETNYTCACAVFKMVLSHFQDDVPSESELALLLETDPTVGTHPDKIKELAPSFGLTVLEGENGNLDDLNKMIDDGWVVTLLVSVDVPHYTVYLGHNGNHAKFNDPWFGETYHLVSKFTNKNHVYPFYRWKVDPSEFEKYYDGKFSHKSNKGWIAFKK